MEQCGPVLRAGTCLICTTRSTAPAAGGAKPIPEAARYDLNWLSATGTGCFLAAIISGLLLGLSPVRMGKVFWHTLVRMRLAVIAISFMLGLGYVTRYSGLDAVLGRGVSG